MNNFISETGDHGAYPYAEYRSEPAYSVEGTSQDYRFPFVPLVGGIAGGLLAGALFYPHGGGYYYPPYPPYPTYPPYGYYAPYYPVYYR
ncbi:hypothetical protein [Oceanobacillus damuensis]|uniref:hypothetical protein n=1 Tax=Oceanobacillus damuensis TaxID=937928 RepID=UPI000830CBF2|nr:hypothetical protein [Oceanobacillus damuensis]